MDIVAVNGNAVDLMRQLTSKAIFFFRAALVNFI
jgi:hypothetical protein